MELCWQSNVSASWQIDREIMETVGDFILGGSKITADGDCSHEIKRRLNKVKMSFAVWPKSINRDDVFMELIKSNYSP